MGLLLWLVFGSAHAEWAVNMLPGVTEVSRSVFDLHMIIFWICVVIGVVVFGVMFWSMLIHRRSTGQQPAHFHESTTVEILWTVVPFVILVAMAVPATKTLIDIYDTSESELDIQVTGYQWMWKYEYLGENVTFTSRLDRESDRVRQSGIVPTRESHPHYLLDVDNRLVLPVDTKVRFVITSDDVIHAWWVPALGWKQDAIPGFINEAWTSIEQPGVYRGQCAELCGKDHGFMPIVVEAVSKEDFKQWLAQRKPAPAAEPAPPAAPAEPAAPAIEAPAAPAAAEAGRAPAVAASGA